MTLSKRDQLNKDLQLAWQEQDKCVRELALVNHRINALDKASKTIKNVTDDGVPLAGIEKEVWNGLPKGMFRAVEKQRLALEQLS